MARGKSHDQLDVSLVNQFLAVAPIVRSPAPALGTVVAMIAWLVNRKIAGWLRKLSKIAVLVSILISIAFTICVIIKITIPHPHHR